MEPIRISNLEMRQNNGDAAKLNLVASKVQIAEKNFKDVLGLGIFSDGTAATGALTTKQYTGFRAMISEATTSYGNISSTDMATWAAQVEDNEGTNRAATLQLMQKVYGLCTEDSDQPTLITSKQNVFDQVWGLYQPHQRLQNEELGKLGFKNLMFNSAPYVVDSHMKDNSIYFINENYVQFAVHPEEDMRRETLEKLETSASMLMRIFLMGNLICSNRRFQGELADLSA